MVFTILLRDFSLFPWQTFFSVTNCIALTSIGVLLALAATACSHFTPDENNEASLSTIEPGDDLRVNDLRS